MDLCSDDHQEVCYAGRDCPVCLKQDEIDKLEEKIERLEAEINALEKERESD